MAYRALLTAVSKVTVMRPLVSRFLRWRPVRYVLAPVLLAIASTQQTILPTLAFLVPGLILQEAAIFAVDRRAEQLASKRLKQQKLLESERAERRLTERLNDAVTAFELVAGGGGRLRANVMLPEPSGDFMTIRFSTVGYSPEELAMRWGRHQGPYGHAWAEGRSQIAPSGEPPNGWGMTPAQRALTASLGMTIAVPVSLPERPGEVVAVISVDDSEPPGEYSDAIREYLEKQVSTRVATELAGDDVNFLV